MTATTIRVQMAQRKDTAANWTAANPILLSGEIGYETDAKKFKIGDGTTNWNSLAYLPIPDGSGNLTITGNLEIGSTGSLTFEGSTADGFETTLAVTDPTADRTITLPDVSGTVVTTGDTGSVTSTMIADGTIVDADVSATAGIAVSKLANGTANQVLVTDGTDVSWSDDLTLAGNLTVNGTTTTVNTETVLVKDKNIEMGVVATPTDLTADGGGITLKGTTDKTINWIDATDAWTSSERFSVPLGSAAAPSLTFTGDPNTGIYSPGADQLALSTNGTGRLFVSSAGNVGIGTTSPAQALHLNEDDSECGIVITSSNTGAAVIQLGDQADTDAGQITYLNSEDALLFRTAGSGEDCRIDSSGRFLIGTSTSYNAPTITGIQIASLNQIHSAAAGIGSQLIAEWSTTTGNGGSSLKLAKSNSGTIGSHTALSLNQDIGSIVFAASDGTNFIHAASILSEVDGTPTTDVMPGRLVFSTTADGASSPTERMRIGNDGRLALISAPSGSTAVTALNNETTFKNGNNIARAVVSVVNSASNGGVPYTIGDMYHFYTFDATHNADATVTNKYGYYAHPSLVESATNTYGFYGAVGSGAGRWNFYAGGTAANYFAGTIASLGSYNATTASAANVFIASNGDIQRSTSSIRYKTDVEDLQTSYADNIIFNARPVWYRSLCEADNASWSYYGLIAEEVAELDPRLVFWGRPTKDVISTEAKPAVLDDDGNEIEPAQEAVYTSVEDTDAELRPEGVQYDRLTVMLIDVVQRQQKTIETLEARLTAAGL